MAGGIQNPHSRHLPQKTNVKYAVMGRTVISHQTGPVNGQHHMQVKQCNILHDLVESPLQEGGIQRHHRHHSLLGKTASHGNGVLLRNAHVKGAVRETPLEFQQPGSAGHGGSNGADTLIFLRQRDHSLAETVGISLRLGGQLFAGLRVEFPNSVEFRRVFLCKTVALSLFRHHMDHHRLPQFSGRAEQGDQSRQIMTVCRSQVGKAHVFKNGRRQQQALELVFYPAAEAVDGVAAGQTLHDAPVGPLGIQIIVAGAQAGQVAGQAAHIFSDGHGIVVDDDHHGLAADGGIVQALIGHAAGQSAIADHGDHIVIFMQPGPRPGHAQGDGNGTGSVSCHKGIRPALLRLGETGNAAVLPQTRKIRPAAGQQLMHIRLVTHIKHQAV